MALTYLQLQDKVLGWLDEGTASDADADTLNRVKEALAEADTERFIEHRWPFRIPDADATLTLVAGQRVYDLDADFHIPLFFWNDSTNSPLIQVNEEHTQTRDYAGGLLDDYFVSSPQYGAYTIRNQKLVLLWTPSTTDTIRYNFYALPTEMEDDADLPNIPYPHSRVLIYDALLRMAEYNEDISGVKLERWGKQQAKHETALREAHLQENSQWTMQPSVTYTPRD
jgi:hypothetical protein